MIVRRLVMSFGLATACTSADDGAAAPESAPAPAEPAVEMDTRDQYALLVDIETALGHGLDRDAAAMAGVKAAWIGRRYRWEVGYVPVFCHGVERCNVTPFDHGRRPEQRIRQGFLPELVMSDAEFAELQAACAGKRRCVVQIEGTMGHFGFSPEEATSIRFVDVDVIGAREANVTESWIVSRVPVRGRA